MTSTELEVALPKRCLTESGRLDFDGSVSATAVCMEFMESSQGRNELAMASEIQILEMGTSVTVRRSDTIPKFIISAAVPVENGEKEDEDEEKAINVQSCKLRRS